VWLQTQPDRSAFRKPNGESTMNDIAIAGYAPGAIDRATAMKNSSSG
jgi:hypothetical protein